MLVMSDIVGMEYSALILMSALKELIIAIRMQLAQTPKEASNVLVIAVTKAMGSIVTPVTATLHLLKAEAFSLVLAMPDTKEVEHSAQTLTSALKEPIIVIQMRLAPIQMEVTHVHVITVMAAMAKPALLVTKMLLRLHKALVRVIRAFEGMVMYALTLMSVRRSHTTVTVTQFVQTLTAASRVLVRRHTTVMAFHVNVSRDYMNQNL